MSVTAFTEWQSRFVKLHGNCPGSILREIESASFEHCAQECWDEADCFGFAYRHAVSQDAISTLSNCVLKHTTCDSDLRISKWMFYRKGL